MTEITKQKDEHPKKHLRDRARKTGEWLRQCMRDIDQPIRPGVWFVRDSKEPRSLASEVGLDWLHQDDRVIAHALKIQADGHAVKVATNDGGLEMKLSDYEISFLEVPDAFLLPPEADPERIRADALARENREWKNRQPDLQFLCEEIGLLRLPDLGDMEAYAMDALRRGQEEFERRFVVPGQFRPHVVVPSLFSPEYSQHLQQIKQHLYAEHRWREAVSTMRGIDTSLKNTGSSTATFIRVVVQPPSGIRLLPLRGTPPYPEYQFGRPEIFKYIPTGNYGSAPSEVVQSFRNYSMPDWDMHKSPGELEFIIERLGIGETLTLPKLYITAAKDNPLLTTRLNVAIFCNEFLKEAQQNVAVHVAA